jgi:hypothetical protein
VTSSFTTLTGAKTVAGSLKRWANHDTLDSEGILTEAEAWIYQRLRTKEMQTIATGTVAIGQDGFALPTGFLAPLRFSIHDGQQDLNYQHEQLINLTLDTDGALPDGTPTSFAIMENAIQFNTVADEAFDYTFRYYAAPTALSASNETNFLTVRYPTLLRRVGLMFAYEFLKHWDAFEKQAVLAERALRDAQVADDQRRMGQEL